MKKILTLILISICGFSAFSQGTIWKDTLTMNIPKDGNIYELYDTVYNSSASPITLTWSRNANSTLLTGWTCYGICDASAGSTGACYTYADLTSHTIIIQPNGKATIHTQVGAAATAADGCNYINVTTNFGPMTFKYCSFPTATKDFDNSNIVTIYPNPAVNYLNINLNDTRITSINVLNVIGKKIARFEVDAAKTPTLNVPLLNVADGIYLLQFSDSYGKVLGVRRVTKQ